MTDRLEQDLREVLQRKFGEVRVPSAPPELIRRTRRRQARTIALGAVVVVALLAGSVGAGLALTHHDSSLPAGRTTSTTINGITVTYPEGWFAEDPAKLGLNGPGPQTEPRLVLAVSNRDPEGTTIFGCPGMAEGGAGAVLFTVQVTALDRLLPTWPVDRRPLPVGTDDSACYPGWDFSQAQWTAGGRSFDGRLGVAPDASDGDRAALLDAFDSMTFESQPALRGNNQRSVVVATGIVAGHRWTITASIGADGTTSLEIEDERGGAGIEYGTDGDIPIQATSHVFQGTGDVPTETVVFGAVPAGTALVRTLPDDTVATLVPDPFVRTMELFSIQVPGGTPALVVAEDADGHEIGEQQLGGTPLPTETPPEPHTSPSTIPNAPFPEPVDPVQGGTYWAVEVAVGQSETEDAITVAKNRLTTMGAVPFVVGDPSCDQGSIPVIPAGATVRVAVYYDRNEDALTFEKAYATDWSGDQVVGVARVTTTCLD